MAMITGMVVYLGRQVSVRADINSGLVAHYTFDDISGVTAPDSSGNNYDGELKGGASEVSGKSGSGVHFDGVDGRVDIPFQLLQTQEPTFSYSFYVKLDADSGDNQYIIGQTAVNPGVHFCQTLIYDNSTNTLNVLQSNFDNDQTITKVIDLSTWTHIVVTNSEAEGKSQLFINGVGVNGDDSSCPQPLAAQFMLGRAGYDGFNMKMKGTIDDVRVYDHALSNADVHTLATAGQTNSLSISTPLDGATVHGVTPIQSAVSGSPSMTSVQYYVDGEVVGSPVTTPPYTYNWDISDYSQGQHTISAVGTDSDGQPIPAIPITVTVDNDPIVNYQSVHSIATTSATVSWVMNELTDGRIEYGTTTSYGSQTSLDTTDKLYHSASLSGLQPNTTYHYRVLATDVNDNQIAGSDATFTTLSTASGNEWHVTTTGTSGGDGSLSDPWDLATALAQPASVDPGDTIWIHGGTYSGTFVSQLSGTAARPIVVRNYNDERAIIDGGTSNNNIIEINGADSWFWGLEIFSSNPDRTTTDSGEGIPGRQRGVGFWVLAARTRLINNIIHDTAQGIGFWSSAPDSELYGNIIFYNGWEGPDGGHGHGIYTQNITGMKNIDNNLVFANFNFGIHAYTEGGRIDNFLMQNNTSFDNGYLSSSGYSTDILVGGQQIAYSPTLIGNSTFFSDTGGTALNLGYNAGCDPVSLVNNSFVGGAAAVQNASCPTKQIEDNLFYGTTPSTWDDDFTDNTFASSAPTTNVALVRPNSYDPDQTYITIYNWEDVDEMNVDLSAVLDDGDSYEVLDAQNIFGDSIANGTYDGSAVSLPLDSTEITPPVGNNIPNPASHSSGRFATLIVKRTASAPDSGGQESGGGGGGNNSGSNSSSTSNPSVNVAAAQSKNKTTNPTYLTIGQGNSPSTDQTPTSNDSDCPTDNSPVLGCQHTNNSTNLAIAAKIVANTPWLHWIGYGMIITGSLTLLFIISRLVVTHLIRLS